MSTRTLSLLQRDSGGSGLIQSLSPKYRSGAYAAGIAKLLQNVIAELMTWRGSVRFDPGYGCGLVDQIGVTNISSLSEVGHVLHVAILDISENIRARMIGNEPLTGPAHLHSIMVSGMYMPHIKEIQDWVLRCGQAPIGLDVLVKGAVPVTTSFSAVLNTPVGTEVDFSSLQAKVANYINNIPFDGVLSLSGLIALLHAALPKESYVSDPALFATQWLSEEAAAFQVRDRLALESLPFGTNRTCILYCDPAEVVFSQKWIEARC